MAVANGVAGARRKVGGMPWTPALAALGLVVGGLTLTRCLPDQFLATGTRYEVTGPERATVAVRAPGHDGDTGTCDLAFVDEVEVLGWDWRLGYLVRLLSGDDDASGHPWVRFGGACPKGTAAFVPFKRDYDGRPRQWLDVDAEARRSQADARARDALSAEAAGAAARIIGTPPR